MARERESLCFLVSSIKYSTQGSGFSFRNFRLKREKEQRALQVGKKASVTAEGTGDGGVVEVTLHSLHPAE